MTFTTPYIEELNNLKLHNEFIKLILEMLENDPKNRPNMNQVFMFLSVYSRAYDEISTYPGSFSGWENWSINQIRAYAQFIRLNNSAQKNNQALSLENFRCYLIGAKKYSSLPSVVMKKASEFGRYSGGYYTVTVGFDYPVTKDVLVDDALTIVSKNKLKTLKKYRYRSSNKHESFILKCTCCGGVNFSQITLMADHMDDTECAYLRFFLCLGRTYKSCSNFGLTKTFLEDSNTFLDRLIWSNEVNEFTANQKIQLTI